jgi:MFS family permease
VRLLSAPFAVLVDAASYLVSALILYTIRVPEQVPQRAPGRHVWRELADGASWVYRHRILAPYAVALHLWFFFNSVATTVIVYFAATELRLDALAIGLVLSAAGVTGVVGAGLAPLLARHHGLGLVHCIGTWFSPVAYGLVLLAQPGPRAILWPMVSSLVLGFGMGVSGPLHMSYRNAVTPDRMRGRMNATIRSFNWGSIAVAAPLGGWIAATSGNRAAFVVGCLGLAVSSAIVTFSPYRSADLPTPEEHGGTPDDAGVLDPPAP